MSFPTPENPGRAPLLWENYVIAQAASASRGIIPEHTLAFGVEVLGRRLRLWFQLSELSMNDREDMEDIVSEFEGLVGPQMNVEFVYEVRARRLIRPRDGICWIYLSRVPYSD